MRPEGDTMNERETAMIPYFAHEGEMSRAERARRLFDGITYEKLAEEFDLSVRHTKKIVYDAERKLFKHIP
jgi:hypothetical protein